MNSFLYSYAFKDLFKQKTRTLLGIFGVGISLFLLTSVSFITDSVSYNFIDYLTLDSGNQDIVINVRHYYGEEENRSNFFQYKELRDQIQQEMQEFENYLPRSTFYSLANVTVDNEIVLRYFQFSAMDIKLEEEVNFGSFSLNNMSLELSNGLPTNTCIISEEFADAYHFSNGDIIPFFIPNLNASLNLTVISSFSQDLKFPLDHESDIVVDLSWWGSTANKVYNNVNKPIDWENRANSLILTFKDPDKIYDIRDVEGSERLIMKIGEKLQLLIGLEAWNLEYPKMELLFVSEMFSLGMNILFVVIAFVAMLIAGILINGILSTSVEERIREYGINRVLGARTIYNIKLVVIQASIIILLGTTLGILGAMLFVSKVAIPLLMKQIPEGYATVILFVVQPRSIILSYVIGIGVSLIVSIMPAIKVMRMKIVDAINPYRHSDELYKIVKEDSANVRLIIFGFFVAINSGFVYFILPKILLSLKISMLASILVGTLMLFLVGVSLMAVGLMPILLKLLVKLFDPIAQKYMNIVKINVHRHQRRNLSTIIMFVLSFSFILFTTSMVEIQVTQVGGLIAYENGSDILIRPREYDIEAPTVQMRDKFMQIDGIERVSSLLASTDDLERIYSEENKEFSVTMGDYVQYSSTNIWLYGIDKYYTDTISTEMQQYLVFAAGNKEEAFVDIFNESSSEINIIISSLVASQLKIRYGDYARLTFTRGTEEIPYICKIVGVLKNAPGLDRIREAGLFGGGTGGVIMADFNYIKCLNIPGGDNAFVDKIFLKVKDGYNHTIIENQAREILKNQNYRIDQTQADILEAEESFTLIKYFFLLILLGTVFIAIFGLLTSAYSSIIERKREIGILRTLGLHGLEVERMFLIENLILLLASSTSGGIIGTIMALGLSENMTLFTQTPRMVKFPWDTTLIIYAFSILTLAIGMVFLMRNMRKKNLIEIFRETL